MSVLGARAEKIVKKMTGSIYKTFIYTKYTYIMYTYRHTHMCVEGKSV